MKKTLFFIAVAALLQACVSENGLKVEVYNDTEWVRMNEMVEVDYGVVADKLLVGDGQQVVVLDAARKQVPYQITFDNKLIFLTDVEPGSCAEYLITLGVPDTFAVCAVGAQYPERVDDIAWENDCIAFRAYGPALQESGEAAYGYDVWVKRVAHPVVADRYAAELDTATVAEIARLKSVAPDSAAALYNSVSYHVDHGNGMDYYKVGPTLGAGATALVDADGSIVYPYCYADYQILDNGPLRFTVSLKYRPFVFGNDTVIETRVISLDEGSQLNRIDVVYHGLNEPATVVSGIVLHDTDSVMMYDAERGFVAYAEPCDSINGQTFLGMAYGRSVQRILPVYFDEMEREARGAEGHLLVESIYVPGETLTYYTGAGWSKWGFENAEDWFVYMQYYSATLASPLRVVVE